MAIGNPLRKAKAEDYSAMSGSKKKGAKIRMKPDLDALPTSNVKVVGKKDSSIAQRNPKTLPSRTAPAKIKSVKGKKGLAKTWGRGN